MSLSHFDCALKSRLTSIGKTKQSAPPDTSPRRRTVLKVRWSRSTAKCLPAWPSSAPAVGHKGARFALFSPQEAQEGPQS